jgi:lipopolysaccharide/colanic/teichoic acid biosynthesis glycosyltransferase
MNLAELRPLPYNPVETIDKTINLSKELIIKGLIKIYENVCDSDSPLAQLIDKVSPTEGETYQHSYIKYVLDVGVCLPASIIAIPLITGFAIAIKLDDGGPVFFIQERPGEIPGSKIKVVKLRTMRVGSDKEEQSLKYAKGLPAHKDPRCTRVGAFLREHDLDELPQFIQVLFGDLSLVGNRPLPEYITPHLADVLESSEFIEWLLSNHHTRKGIVGAEQVFGDNKKNDDKRSRYDIGYAQNGTLRMDIIILLREFLNLLHIKGEITNPFL